MPELFETIALNGDGLDKAPYPTVPYYLHAVEGDFLYRDTQIGAVLLRENKKPPSLGRVGYAGGVFNWKGEKVPNTIISQAHDFFRRIYAKHHAEAEVLITMHNETGAFRLFIPYQRVSQMGVKSVYEPTHIHKDYTVVGTLHSHCDFNAFHSGTDSGDASDMDGIHFTIGFVTRDTPQIVAMVTMGGNEFHFPDPTDVADLTYGTDTAPPWWDQYVYPASSPSAKPKSLKSITQAHWDEFRGLVQSKPKPKLLTSGWKAPDRKNGWVSPYKNTHSVNKNNPNTGPYVFDGGLWGDEDLDWRKWVYGGYTKPEVQRELDDNISQALDLAEASGLFHDEDYKTINPDQFDDIEFWKGFYINKMHAAAEALKLLGLETKDITEPKKGPHL